MSALIQFFKDLGVNKLVILLIAVIAIIASIIFTVVNLSSANMTTLYTNLDLKESGDIVSILESENISYQLRANGAQILVPDDKVLKLRLQMAQKGLPTHGSIMGYEIFDDNDSLNNSSFIQNVNLVRALEGELVRTITSIDNIATARVHIVLPKRELFNREAQRPTASIMVKTKGNKQINKNQVSAISHLVASAVPGLDPANITIVDSKGTPFKIASDENGENHFNNNADDFKTNYESRLKFIIEDLLMSSLGNGKVRANVSADMNFDRIVTNSEVYDPDSQVARSVQTSNENASSNDNSSNQPTSVASNLPGGASANEGAGGSSTKSSKTDEVTNFEISKTITNHISEVGSVKKLSIAVLVDGTYPLDPTTKTYKYVPRTSQELQEIEELVKSAVGFDDKRKDQIKIINMQFNNDLEALKEETIQEWLKSELPSLIQIIMVGVILILVILLVIRPMVIRAFEIKNEVFENQTMEDLNNIITQAGETSISPGNIAGKTVGDKMFAELSIADERKKVTQTDAISHALETMPNESLMIIRKWLNE